MLRNITNNRFGVCSDGPDDGKAAGQAKDNHTRETGLNSTDPLPLDNTMAMDHYCDPVLSRNKSCCPSNFQVEQVDPFLNKPSVFLSVHILYSHRNELISFEGKI